MPGAAEEAEELAVEAAVFETGIAGADEADAEGGALGRDLGGTWPLEITSIERVAPGVRAWKSARTRSKNGQTTCEATAIFTWPRTSSVISRRSVDSRRMEPLISTASR